HTTPASGRSALRVGAFFRSAFSRAWSSHLAISRARVRGTNGVVSGRPARFRPFEEAALSNHVLPPVGEPVRGRRNVGQEAGPVKGKGELVHPECLHALGTRPEDAPGPQHVQV